MSDAVIRTENLTKTFKDFWGRDKLTAVKNLSIEVHRGEIFGFIGPNGSGKTTTMKLLLGLLFPTSGTAHVLDKSPTNVAVKQRIGYIPDRPYIYEKLTGSEFLSFVAGLYRVRDDVAAPRIVSLLAKFGLAHWGDNLVESYSHGMKQRLVLCAALVHEPVLVVIDEPMVGLDPAGAKLLKDVFRALCREDGRTVFLSTHTLDVAEEVCDRIAIINRGKLVAVGTLDELRALAGETNGRFEDVFFRLTEGQTDPS